MSNKCSLLLAMKKDIVLFNFIKCFNIFYILIINDIHYQIYLILFFFLKRGKKKRYIIDFPVLGEDGL